MLLLVAMCLHADQNLAAPNLSAIADEFEFDAIDKDRRLGGQVQLGFFAVGGLTSMVMGPLADRMNRLNLLVLVVLFGSVPCALIVFVPSGELGFYLYFCSRVLTGVSVGGSFPLLYSLCGDLATAPQRAMISAAMGVATAMGVAIGQLLSGFLGPWLGWRAPFPAVAYPAIFTVMLLWLTVQEPSREGMPERPHSEPRLQVVAPAEEVGELLEGAGEHDEDGHVMRGRAPVAEKCHEGEPGPTDAQDPQMAHGTTDCTRFGSVLRGSTNRLVLLGNFPGCVCWSTVTTFLPDYLHSEQGLRVESATMLVACFGISCLAWAVTGAAVGQRMYNRNKQYLSYLMAFFSALAVVPFWLLINSPAEALQGALVGGKETAVDVAAVGDSGGARALPSMWALFLCLAGGCAAVTNPNSKALLMNVNPANSRGTVFALVTLTDDVGKGLGPGIVSLGIQIVGRKLALSLAMSCWLVTSVLLYCTRWTIGPDTQRMELVQKLPMNV